MFFKLLCHIIGNQVLICLYAIARHPYVNVSTIYFVFVFYIFFCVTWNTHLEPPGIICLEPGDRLTVTRC